MARLVYFLLLFNLGCFLFDGFVAGCMEFIAEKHQREGSFAKRSPIEVEECVELCVQTDICFAVNYFRLNATCQFLNRTMPESKLVKAAKCLYKSVRGPPKESIDKDPCYQKLCPWDEICIHNTTTNLAQCYPLCKNPPVKSGAINETAEVEIGQNYTYKCQDGLFGKQNQNPTVTCLPDGNWTPTNFTCVCKTPPVKSGAIYETAEVELGHNFTYRCQDGLSGKQNQNPTVTCLPGGNWTPTNFTCVCKTPIAKSGTINESAEVELGQNYTYRCQDGLIGKRYQNSAVMCLPGGEWMTTNFTCGAINKTAEVEIGQNYTYRCEDNLFERGDQNPTVTCLHDGSWTSTNFICVQQNWTQDTIYPNNIHKSEIISNVTGIDLLACMQECDKEPTNCLSFFYDNHTSFCVLSSSFQRGLPEGFQHSDGLVYYTAPSTSCDVGYIDVVLGGSFFCVKHHKEHEVFNEAMKACESEKAKLLVVTTMAQITDLTNVWLNWYWPIYIGLYDQTEEGRWVSWNGEIVYPFWDPGQPDNLNDQHCACTWWRGGIHDFSCNNTFSFLCHKNHF